MYRWPLRPAFHRLSRASSELCQSAVSPNSIAKVQGGGTAAETLCPGQVSERRAASETRGQVRQARLTRAPLSLPPLRAAVSLRREEGGEGGHSPISSTPATLGKAKATSRAPGSGRSPCAWRSAGRAVGQQRPFSSHVQCSRSDTPRHPLKPWGLGRGALIPSSTWTSEHSGKSH